LTELASLPVAAITNKQPAGFGGSSRLNPSPLVFLALSGQFFSAFFRMNKNVVRISEMLFPFLARFA